MSGVFALSSGASDTADRATTTRPQKAVRSGGAMDGQIKRWLPWAIALALTVFYAAVSIRRHVQLLTSAYDLGIYDQAVRSYSHFSLPWNSVQGPHFDILGDHFSPVLALLAPLYWIHDSPTTLLAAQGALIAVAVVPLMRWAHEAIGLGAALVTGLGYGLSFGVANAVTFDFHEVAFAAPLIAFGAVALGQGRLSAAVAWAAPLIFVKEDLGLTVAVVGLLVAWKGRRMLGALTAAGGVLGSALAVLVFIPAMNPLGHNTKTSKFGTSIAHQAVTLLSPDVKILTLVFLLAPTVFLAVRSPIIALAVPTLLWRFLATDSNYWGLQFHYSLILMPIVFAAFIDVLRRRKHREVGVFLIVSALVTLYLIPQNGFAPAFKSSLWRTNAATSQIHDLLSRIPSGATVAASNMLLPQISERDHVTLIGRTPLGVSRPSYIVSETADVGFPLGTDGQNAWLTDARQHGYRDIGSAGSVVLLAKT